MAVTHVGAVFAASYKLIPDSSSTEISTGWSGSTEDRSIVFVSPEESSSPELASFTLIVSPF